MDTLSLKIQAAVLTHAGVSPQECPSNLRLPQVRSLSELLRNGRQAYRQTAGNGLAVGVNHAHRRKLHLIAKPNYEYWVRHRCLLVVCALPFLPFLLLVIDPYLPSHALRLVLYGSFDAFSNLLYCHGSALFQYGEYGIQSQP